MTDPPTAGTGTTRGIWRTVTDLLDTPANQGPLDPDAGGLESAVGTPASESRFPCLDGCRAIAAFLVLLTHVGFDSGRSIQGPGYSIISRGDIGVPLFFVLSGFLLYRPMARARLSGKPLPSVRDYLARRALRIVPAFWVAAIVVMLVLDRNAVARHDPVQWIRHLGFAQVYSNTDPTRGMEQDWSLDVEVTFYLLLPFWPRLLRRLTRRSSEPSVAAEFVGAAVLLVASIAWIILGHGKNHVLNYEVGNWLPEHLDWFAGGMLLAVLSLLPTLRPRAAERFRGIYELADSPGTCLLLAAAIWAIALTPVAGPYNLALESVWSAVLKELIYCAFAVAFLLPGCLGDQSRGWSRAVLRTPVLQKLGEISYGIFLWHTGVMYVIRQLLHQREFTHNFPEMLLLTSIGSVLMAYLSFVVIERPAMRLKDRYAARSARPH
jgi:peptidoglycan/LPS O-acetylase OafA/YrhL